jgi:hypothetical protein
MRMARMQLLAALAAAPLATACSDSDTGEVSLQVSTRHLPGAGAAALEVTASAGQLSITAGDDQIMLDQVQIVLRKIRLDGAPTASCPEDGEGDSQCAEIRLGPVLFDLPLSEEAEPVFTALVPVGTYDGFKFQIHKPSNANEDAALVAEHPEMEDVSIRVVGTYNGTPFIFVSDLTEVEEVTLPQGVEVAADGSLPLTLRVDVAGWFAGGGGLIDPALATEGGALESEVEQSIRESFRAFRDGNADGLND